jgi:hypothetical protein
MGWTLQRVDRNMLAFATTTDSVPHDIEFLTMQRSPYDPYEATEEPNDRLVDASTSLRHLSKRYRNLKMKQFLFSDRLHQKQESKVL